MRTWPATAATAVFVLLAGCSAAAAPATVAVSSPHPATASAGGLRESDADRRKSPGVLAEVPHLVDL